MRHAWVKVDLNRVTLRIWRSQGKWYTGADLRRWLGERGYTWGGGAWYLCENEPCDLEPDEIVELQTRITEDGITYIDRSGDGPGPGAATPPVG